MRENKVRSDLVLVVEVVVGQLGGHELVEHDPVRVHVGVEGVGRRLRHAHHLGGHPQDGARGLLPRHAARAAHLCRMHKSLATCFRP